MQNWKWAKLAHRASEKTMTALHLCYTHNTISAVGDADNSRQRPIPWRHIFTDDKYWIPNFQIGTRFLPLETLDLCVQILVGPPTPQILVNSSEKFPTAKRRDAFIGDVIFGSGEKRRSHKKVARR